MKRLIAALLTAAMTISIVPFSAFADESGADALLGEAAVESTETQQEDIPLVPENTDDPFQQNDAQEQAVEEQTQQAEVDTSDVSLTATNSFGQLLVNSMDEQNGASGEYSSRITGLKLNGHTATVEFVADQDADLVVAVYTDSDAEEMVASGTVKVEADNNEEALVEISEIVLTKCTVKAYLLDVENHTPLCETYIKTIDLEPTPESTYEVTISLEDVVDEGIVINEKMEDGTLKKLGKTDEKGILNIQLKLGKYIVTATVQDKTYSSEFEIVDKSVQVELKAESEKPAPEPDEPDENIVESGKCGESLYWELDKQGKLTIHGIGMMDEYDSAYASPWYKKRESIKSIEIREGVENISKYAFYNCSNLTTIAIPNGLTNIGDYAFYNCKKLEDVQLPISLMKIGSGAFYGCEEIDSIEIPSNVDWIGANTFAECKKMESVTIPGDIRRICDNAFKNCESLKKVSYKGKEKSWNETIIDSGNIYLLMATIQCTDGIVGNCGAQEDNVQWRINDDNCLIISGTGKMKNYSHVLPSSAPSSNWTPWYRRMEYIKKVIIEEGVTSIGDYAFSGCKRLVEVTIPEGVTSVGSYAFSSCDMIKKINLPDGVTKIDDYAFEWCRAMTEIRIPDSVVNIGNGAFQWCVNLKEVILPERLSDIKSRTFDNCMSMTDITSPVSVTSIGYAAFMSCYNLDSVVYKGTRVQCSMIAIEEENGNLLKATIHCTDGDIIPVSTSSENSVTTGSTTANNGTFCATFDNVSAGKDYAVIISRSSNDPLNADNLIYINQVTADADGELSVPFRTSAGTGEMAYIVACVQDDVIVDPDQPTEPDIPSDNDSGSSSGGGGDGAGAAVAIIGGVVAVAAVAGVVMLMPVEVSGTVKNAEQAILPGVSVQVLQGDTVVAQTITDEAGHFTVKVRRGDYTLNVSYTDTDGQLATKTIDIKAPSKNMDVAA